MAPVSRSSLAIGTACALLGVVAACIPVSYLGWLFGTFTVMFTSGSSAFTSVYFIAWMALFGVFAVPLTALPLKLWLNANRVELSFKKSFLLVFSGVAVHIYLAVPFLVPGQPRGVDVPETLVVLPIFSAAVWALLREQVADTDTRRGTALLAAAVTAVVLPVPTAVDGVRARVLIENTPAEMFAVPVLDHPDWNIDKAELPSGTVSYYNGTFEHVELALQDSDPACYRVWAYCRRHGEDITVVRPKDIIDSWGEDRAVGPDWVQDPAAYVDLGDRWAVLRARSWAMPADLTDTDALVALAETVRLAGPEDHMALARNQQRWDPY
ncbi:hypothetical protein [Nocardiopsis baichengensis]|uniref:hypothetical protein n=1 Tax=Nocardiopsis baichengensis TaxID=280240 RepID=UPI0003489417|nr:hypothetical protein [Nocardiopsis baichengensis]